MRYILAQKSKDSPQTSFEISLVAGPECRSRTNPKFFITLVHQQRCSWPVDYETFAVPNIKKDTYMPFAKGSIASLIILLSLIFTAKPNIGEAQPIAGNLVVVPEKKLPPEARREGQAMDLHLVNPSTLYLYVEREEGRQIAIFDVSDPQKIKFKRIVQLEAPAPFDFVQPAGQSLEMIRYRDGRGMAILDLSKPKNPVLKAVGDPASQCYIVPVEIDQNSPKKPAVPQDYQIIEPSAEQSIATIRDVVQQQTDEGNATSDKTELECTNAYAK
jgi:hypothetical protein